jgi:hypothetical protein
MATGVFSLPAISISTSGVDRVSCSGRMTGPAAFTTGPSEPDSGTLSVQPSRNEWSGRIRSAWTLVSSMKLPKLAMNGTFASASRSPHAFGDPYTGLASSRSSTCADRLRSSCEGRVSDGPAWSDAGIGVKNTPPGCPTLPRTVFRVFTASAWNRPLDCASGAPPTIATAGLRAAISWARRSSFFAGTPAIDSTAAGAYSASDGTSPLPAPLATSRCAIPSATTPSVPGLT